MATTIPGSDVSWQPGDDTQTIVTVDTHTAGEPLRIALRGLPDLSGGNVLEKRRVFMDKYDHLRTGLLLEPRGHNDMYGAIVTPSTKSGELDVFFINTEDYSPMCGHAILALAYIVFETTLMGKHDVKTQQVFNTPAGPCYAGVRCASGKVQEAYFRNVASFVYLKDKTISIPEHTDLHFDVSFGGAFYAIVDAQTLQLELIASQAQTLIKYARAIKKEIQSKYTIKHPFEADLNGLFGVIFVGAPHNPKNHSRNVNVFEDQEIDRSPTGTGVSARCALHVARGDFGLGHKITIESIIGSEMSVEAVGKTSFGSYEAIIPEVSGTAFITGKHELYFNPEDPFRAGFALR